jgi:hypothetical protein
MGVGYRDIRGNEYSVYHAINYRNLGFSRVSQMPSGTISEATGTATPGIRLFDLHGKDIGEYAHRARHSGKFGTDSAYVLENIGYGLTGSFAAPRLGADPGPISVGAGAYNYTSTMASSLQGWWRLNKNISTAGDCEDSSGNNRNGTFAAATNRPAFSTSLYPSTHMQAGSCTFDGGGTADDGTSVGTAATWDAIIGNNTGAGSTEKMTFSAWVYKTGDGENNYGRILDFGDSDLYVFTDTDDKIYIGAKWNGNNAIQWRTTEAISLNAWAHVVITYDATSSSNDPKIYINGIAATVSHYSGTKTGAYYGIVGQEAHIGNRNTGDRTFEGQIADVAVWNDTLAPEAVKAIYYSGLNGSTNPDGPGATYIQDPARYKIQRNTKKRMEIRADGTYATSSRYDNYNVQHQIPQSDIQYNWIARSVTDPNSTNYFDYQKTYGGNRQFRKLTATTYEPFFAFVSASDEKGTVALAGGFQPVGRLNTLTLDAVSGAENTMGFPDTAIAAEVYLNAAFNDTTNIPSASYLNLLLSRREATYGWTWRMWRAGFESPILTEEMKANQLSAVASGSSNLYNFSLPPVSMKGRTSRINYDAGYSNPVQLAAGKRNNITLRSSHTNEKIYFNQLLLNNLAAPDPNSVYTPLDSAIDMTKAGGFRTNWIIYSQNVFPSMRNEFTSRSTSRIGYDNGFWRNSNKDRINLFTSTKQTSSFGMQNTDGYWIGVSQSAWCLDAPEDFLTRYGPPLNAVTAGAGWTGSVIVRAIGHAGELQNTWTQYVTGTTAAQIPSRFQSMWRYANTGIGPLYARKHMLGSPRSVVAPSGIQIPETGSYPRTPSAPQISAYPTQQKGPFGVAEFRSVSASEGYSGEALWEAPVNAGIIYKSGSSGKYMISASNPWFNDYDAFHADLKLAARGYSTVPEFRISEHVEDYIKFGAINPGTMNTFSIPGTGIDSTTASFYKDYSNSDFLQGFLKIKNKSMLDLAQIKLTIEAAIRFNPYKGFYPAQRTLDLVSQFSRSYGPGLNANYTLQQPIVGQTDNNTMTGSTSAFSSRGGVFRPVITPLFAPGILYNSIKSGIAVDYPVVTNPDRMIAKPYGGDASLDALGPEEGRSPDNWALSTSDAHFNDKTSRFSGSYFDFRMPFEAIIEPEQYIRGKYFLDMEPHPSCSLATSASWDGSVVGSYTAMAANFFGEVGNFFLRDRDFTNLESNVLPTDIKFAGDETFGARVILRRSAHGTRTYQYDSGSNGSSEAFTAYGGKTYVAADPATNFAKPLANGVRGYVSGTYPIPQDPKRNSTYAESFTMYSRPTAFGPPLSGRYYSVAQAANTGSLGNSGSVDCFDGYNWAFTPPYYHGEAWADLIFRPSASGSYDLERILAETKVQYWRCDPGAPSGSTNKVYQTTLIPGGVGGASLHGPGQGPGEPYAGTAVNNNAMQLSASFNLFGVERVFKTQGGLNGTQTNETIGAKWIIQPKFETPMMDFGDRGLHPNTSGSGNLTIPLYGSASVPRGMWHQFGRMPIDKERGVFLTIGEIPSDWLNNHWAVINSASVYNNFSVPTDKSRFNQAKNYKSLATLAGFDRKNSSIKLGRLAESKILREAVVAVPYILQQPEVADANLSEGSEIVAGQKKFIRLDPKLVLSAVKPKNMPAPGVDGVAGYASNLTQAGQSIKNLVQKMRRYVLPPQFDFLNNNKISPMAMYIFEFEYKLDKSDLSYIWQNLAPRDYQKMSFQKSSVAHELFDTELLNENNLLDNPNLRWMVFKVKQRSQVEYWDLITDQVGQASTQIWGAKRKVKEGYKLSYNWPYDFISFVEAIKVDVDVMYKNPSNQTIPQNAQSNTKANQKNKDSDAQMGLQNKRRNTKKGGGNNY